MDSTPFKYKAYVAYMLRLWHAGSLGGQPVWRASLENPHTGERLAFGDTRALFAFLADLTTFRAEFGSIPEVAEPTGVDESASSSAAGEDAVE